MDYSFFDYKYNITGYSGQDFESMIRYLYLAFSIIALPYLTAVLGHKGKQSVVKLLKFLSVFLILEEIFKISWESYWDITTGRGFNAGGILPLETCSIFLYVLPFAAYGKGKAKRIALDWISSLGIMGGISYILFPMALKWYPLFSFGAWHSLMFHFMMVLAGLAIVASGLVEIRKSDVLYGFIPQLLMALIVLPLNYHFNWDYMLLRNASGIPFVEEIASGLASRNLGWITPIMVLTLYFLIAELLMRGNRLLQKHIRSNASANKRLPIRNRAYS